MSTYDRPTVAPANSLTNVREASNADADNWDRFLAAHPAGTFYHQYGWKGIVERQFGHHTSYLMALEAAQVVGVLPLVLVSRRLFGNILCSLPFLNYGGPCAASKHVTGLLISEAIRKSRELGADYMELRCAVPLPTDISVSLHKVSMAIALDADPEGIWDRFTSKHRNNVRRAYKSGLVIQSGGPELLDEFYAVLERSWRDLGTPLYQRAYFESILDTFSEQTRIYVCRHDSHIVCAAFNGMYAGVAKGMWAGALPCVRELQAHCVLYWEMIRDSCLRGCRWFHLGRSTVDSGSKQFKSRWNAKPRQLYWYFHRSDDGSIRQLNVENPRYRLAIAAWRRLPLWVARRLSPALARCIP